jgi:glycosyltransferase involved in cell wall biosynthesis
MFHVKHSAPHVLLINPWIYDFAAYNLWAHPLGLLEIGGKLRDLGIRVSLIDCTDAENFSIESRFKPKISLFGTSNLKRTPIEKPVILSDIPRHYCRYGISPDDYYTRLTNLPSPDLILVTSIMTYWYPGVRDAIAAAKEVFPETPVWLGGIYASLLPEHARETCRPDMVLPGPFTKQRLEELRAFLGTSDNQPHSSPFCGLPFWEGYDRLHFLCVRTSTGCPFHCPYCASNILTPRFTETPVPETLKHHGQQ